MVNIIEQVKKYLKTVSAAEPGRNVGNPPVAVNAPIAANTPIQNGLFCTNCGNQLNPGAAFCPMCGNKVQ